MDILSIEAEADEAPIKASAVSEPAAKAASVEEEAPFEEDDSGNTEAVVLTPDTTPNAPAVGRSKLFGDLKRPDNSAE